MNRGLGCIGCGVVLAMVGIGGLMAWQMFLMILPAAVLASWFGLGGNPHPPPTGTALARSVEWIDAPQVTGSALPNAVIAAVMAHESGGQVFASNYNCEQGQVSAGMPCSQRYHPGALGIGQTLRTLSEDAGLMQINSGGWPVPKHAYKWRSLHMATHPFNPSKNLAAGVSQLQGDLGQGHGYLSYALEAYNSGSGGPGNADTGYAQAVQADLLAYAQGPVISVWSTAAWRGGRWRFKAPYVWLLASAAGPYGPRYDLLWAPSPLPPRCHLVNRALVCQNQPPETVQGNDLVLPTSVTANGTRMAMDPKGAPIWPSSKVWAIKARAPGTYRIVASFPGAKSVATSITLCPPKFSCGSARPRLR